MPEKLPNVASGANVPLIVQVPDRSGQRTTSRPYTRKSRKSAPPPLGFARSHDNGRNRVESRVVTRNSKTGLVPQSSETAFYIAKAPATAIGATAAIRRHWRNETTSHDSRNITIAEDRARIRSNPGVFARVRSFAFNILKANQTTPSATTAAEPPRGLHWPPQTNRRLIALKSPGPAPHNVRGAGDATSP